MAPGDETLTYAGTGTVNLPNAGSADTYNTTLNGATLNVGNPTSLGTGTLGGIVTLTSGTIEAGTTGINLANPLTFSSAGSVTTGGANGFTLSGAVTLTGTDTLTQNDTGGLTLSGGTGGTGTLNVVFGSNDALTAAGTSAISLGSITTSGTDTLTQNDTGGLTVSGGTSGTGTLNLAFGAPTAATFSGTTPSSLGAVTLSGSDTLTLSGAGGTTIKGAITGTGSDTLTLSGTGTLNLSATETDPDNQPTVLSLTGAGTVNVATSTALGTGALTLTSGTISPWRSARRQPGQPADVQRRRKRGDPRRHSRPSP